MQSIGQVVVARWQDLRRTRRLRGAWRALWSRDGQRRRSSASAMRVPPCRSIWQSMAQRGPTEIGEKKSLAPTPTARPQDRRFESARDQSASLFGALFFNLKLLFLHISSFYHSIYRCTCCIQSPIFIAASGDALTCNFASFFRLRS